MKCCKHHIKHPSKLTTNSKKLLTKKRRKKGRGSLTRNFLTTNAKKVLRRDPTRTGTLRKLLIRELRKRFAKLKLKVVDLLLKEDALGLKQRKQQYSINSLHRYSSTQFNLTDAGYPRSQGSPLPDLQRLANSIEDADLAEDGRESELHITVKYGLHTNAPEAVRRVVNGFNGISIKLGKVSLFPASDGARYDVVKVDVDSPDLHRLNALLSDSLEHTDTHPIYRPHVTLAYVKPGLGVKYAGDTSLEGRVLHLHDLVFSDSEGNKTTIDILNKQPLKEDALGLKVRKPLVNVFCATGKGGGVDPSGYGPSEDTIKNFVEKVVKRSTRNTLIVNDRWTFKTDAEKVAEFQRWLRTQIDVEVLEGAEDVWEAYVRLGYTKGAGRSYQDFVQRHPELRDTLEDTVGFRAGTERGFLQATIGRPESVDKVKLLAGRAYDDLEGVTSEMSTRMVRHLTDGLVQGKGPREIARELADDVDGIGLGRATTIARTEIIRAHAEGQLQALEDLGVEEVGVMVEWRTAEDEGVCELCAPLEGVVLKIDEAHGMIPRHPNCRCALIPANVGEDEGEQQRGQKTVQKAIRTSQERSGDDDEEGWGPGAKISKERPQSVLNRSVDQFSTLLNRFCATGPGGGVNPSCGGEGTGSSKGTLGGKVKGAIQEAVDKASEIEHKIGEKVGEGFAKLPQPVQKTVKGILKVAFSAWTAGQAMAERVAKERGLTDEQAAKLRSVLATSDLVAFKAAKVGAFSGIPGAGTATTISGTIPVASAGYLAYSTARDPLATYRAAKGVVKDVVAKVKERRAARAAKTPTGKPGPSYKPSLEQVGNTQVGNAMVTNEEADALVKAMAEHEWNEWYVSLLNAALDESEGDIELAIEVANEAYETTPVENVFCATGEGGGVDPTCSPSGATSTTLFGRDGDKKFRDIIPEKMSNLLSESKVTFDETISGHSGQAVGVTKHGEEGPRVRWGEGNEEVGFHELGHAMLYPRKVNGVWQDSPLLAKAKEISEAAHEEYKTSGGGLLKLDTTSFDVTEELWPDLVSAYTSPRTHLLMRSAMPKTFSNMREVLGDSPLSVPISPKLEEVLKQMASKGHLSKRRDLEPLGLTSSQAEKISDIIVPDSGFKSIAKYRAGIKLAEKQITTNTVSNTPLENVFCATGEGGGIDPSCGTGDSGSSKGDSNRSSVRVVSDRGGEYLSEFSAGDKQFDFSASRESKAKDSWSVTFADRQEDRIRLTGEAGTKAVSIMRTAGEALDKFVEAKAPKEFSFTADADEPSRVKLYDRVAKTIADRHSYGHERTEEYGAVKYLFTKKESTTKNLQRLSFAEHFDLNVFCATGEGGGIDATCSPGESSADTEKPGFHTSLAAAKSWGEKRGIHVVEGVSGTPVSRDQLNEVNQHIAKLPSKVQQIMDEAGSKLEVVGGSGITDHPSNAHLKGVTPRGWEDTDKTWDDVPGASAFKAGGTTLIAARAMNNPNAHGSANLVLHEHAHGLDLNLAKAEKLTTRLASHQKEWKDIHSSQKWGNSYEKDYPEEAWAESFAKMYHGEKSRSKLPATVRKYFLDKFGDSPNKSPESKSPSTNERKYVGESPRLVPIFDEEGRVLGDMVVAAGDKLPNY